MSTLPTRMWAEIFLSTIVDPIFQSQIVILLSDFNCVAFWVKLIDPCFNEHLFTSLSNCSRKQPPVDTQF